MVYMQSHVDSKWIVVCKKEEKYCAPFNVSRSLAARSCQTFTINCAFFNLQCSDVGLIRINCRVNSMLKWGTLCSRKKQQNPSTVEDWVFPLNFTEQPSDALVWELQSHTVQIYVSKNILLGWDVVRFRAETKFLYSLESTSVLLCVWWCDSILIRVGNNDSLWIA